MDPKRLRAVYQTTNTTDAHVAANLLTQHDIDAHVLGEGLGAYAHALGSVRVMVPAEQEADARKTLAEWEAGQVKEPAKNPTRFADGMLITLIIAGLLVAAFWYYTAI